MWEEKNQIVNLEASEEANGRGSTRFGGECAQHKLSTHGKEEKE